MLFPTVSFAVFFLVAFTVSWLLRPSYRVWLWVMTAISFWFYGYSDARFVWLLAFSIVSSWAFGRAIHRSLTADGQRTPLSTNLVRAAVVIDLGLLGWFKYYGFFVDSISGVGAAHRVALSGGGGVVSGSLTGPGLKLGTLVAKSNTGYVIEGNSTTVSQIDNAVLYEQTAACVPQGTWDYYAVPFNGSGVAGPPVPARVPSGRSN